MFDNQKLKTWSDNYWNQIKRNIGLVTFSEQEKLRRMSIAVLGIGGLGGPLAEQLIRVGCENIIICDNDKFQKSNLNRQLCTRNDIGKYKVNVLTQYLKKINPEIKIRKYFEINDQNINDILNEVQVVALTLDDPVASILISRECLKRNIPMIESYGMPYLCAWWFTSESIDYEICYELGTKDMSILQLKKSQEILTDVKKKTLTKLLKFPGIKETYDREKGAAEGIISGKLPFVSIAPIVRMTASYIAFEIIYSGILKVKKMVLAPNVLGYDYIQMKPIEFSFL